MTAQDQSVLHHHLQRPVYDLHPEVFGYVISLLDSHLNSDFTENLFDQEGPFGEADCAGL